MFEIGQFIRDVEREVGSYFIEQNWQKFYRIAGEVIVSDIQSNVFQRLGHPFETMLDYTGQAVQWQDIKLSTKLGRRRGNRGVNREPVTWPGLVLQRRGNLVKSIFFELTANGVEIGFGMDYGKYLLPRWRFLFLSANAVDEIELALQRFIS